jgi:hypothetical protein
MCESASWYGLGKEKLVKSSEQREERERTGDVLVQLGVAVCTNKTVMNEIERLLFDSQFSDLFQYYRLKERKLVGVTRDAEHDAVGLSAERIVERGEGGVVGVLGERFFHEGCEELGEDGLTSGRGSGGSAERMSQQSLSPFVARRNAETNDESEMTNSRRQENGKRKRKRETHERRRRYAVPRGTHQVSSALNQSLDEEVLRSRVGRMKG